MDQNEKDAKLLVWIEDLLAKEKEELQELSTNDLNKIKKALDTFIHSATDVLIIKGAAGTGKTKSIEVLAELNNNKDFKYKIFTPTYAAASNIRSRKLGNVETIQWLFNLPFSHQRNLLKDVQILLMDESSMLTAGYLEDILNFKERINNKLKFIFIGDSAQVRPYDAGIGDKEFESLALIGETFERKNLRYQTLELEIPWRFIQDPQASKEFLYFLYRLRHKERIKELLTLFPRCKEIEYVKEKNDFLNSLHRQPSALEYVIDFIEDGVNKETILEAIKIKYPSLIYEDKLQEIDDTIEILKNENKRTPEIGNIYESVINENKNNTTVIVRGREQSMEITKALRSSIYGIKNENKINKNDLIRINSPGSNIFYKGDIVRILNEPKKFMPYVESPISESLDIFFNSFYKVIVERVMIGNDFLEKDKEHAEIIVNTDSLDKIDYQDYREWTNSIREEIDELVNKTIGSNRSTNFPAELKIYQNLTLDDLKMFEDIDNRFKKRERIPGIDYTALLYEDDNDITLRLKMWEEMEKLVGHRKYTIREMISPTLRPEKYKKVKELLADNPVDSDEFINYQTKFQSIDIQYGYSLTGFASQGGEWENVIIEDSDVWDDPRWLYTAISRAKNKIYFSNYTLK